MGLLPGFSACYTRQLLKKGDKSSLKIAQLPTDVCRQPFLEYGFSV